MTGWFGESWGAPACDPEEHLATPVGKSCVRCLELIIEGDQGIIMPLVLMEERRSVPIAYHLDCFLQTILPHTHECPRCRGKERGEHAPRCEYRQGGGNCDCIDVEDV